MRIRLLRATALAAVVTGSLASAQQVVEIDGKLRVERTFPLVATEAWNEMGISFVPDYDLMSELERDQSIVLRGAVVPSHEGPVPVDFVLDRVDPVADDAELFLNDERIGGAEELRAGVSLWAGHVLGEPDSDVYLAFTGTGTNGWVDRAEGRTYLGAVPNEGDWYDTTALMVHQDDSAMAGADYDWTCELDSIYPDGLPDWVFEDVHDHQSTGGHQHGTEGGVIECKIAVTSDYDYFLEFGDVTAATNYAISLWGATSERFSDSTNTFITIPYLAIYDNNTDDPWVVGDNGGNSSNQLNQFQAAWGGSPFPGDAQLAHLMSGAGLGGGVAYLSSLCNTGSGFAVSGNMHGMTNFPVPQFSSLNWDFVVVTHETGHNFGSPHTHDYCPPVDECYPGFCSSGSLCPNGTIMGYCHLCGGMSNVETRFANRVGNRMKDVVQLSCLCASCPCNGPNILSFNPETIDSYVPGGQTIVITGQRLADVHTVYVEGVPISPDYWEILHNNKMHLTWPRASRTGSIDVVVEDGCGPSSAKTLTVTAPATPVVGLEDGPLISWASGLPMISGATDGDLVFIMWSPDEVPSTAPGFFDFDIGAGLATLQELWFFTMGEAAWQKQTFDVTALPLLYTFFLQAAVLTPGEGFPLEMSNVAIATIWI